MSYFLSRFLHGLSLWLGVIAVTFALFHIVPADPVRTMLGPNASEEQVMTVRHSLGLDKPVPAQFGDYIARMATLDFGRSFVDGRPVGPEVLQKLAVTASLAAIAIAIVMLYLAGSVALWRFGRSRSILRGLEFLCVSLPTLFSGVVVALAVVAYYPFTRYSGSLGTWEDWLYLLPPALVLALYPMGILGRIAADQMREIAELDFVRAAHGRGLTSGSVLRGYIFRNSLVPIMAAFGNQLPLLLTSTFIVEIVFSVPGIGALLLKSVLERDLLMLEGIVVMTGFLTIATSLLLELAYPLADPRMREHRVA